MGFDKEQQRRYDQYYDLLRAHGYFISAEPIDGMEDVFLDALKQACVKVEGAAAELRRLYGYRRLSKRLLEELHVYIRCPSDIVDSCLFAEMTNRERR